MMANFDVINKVVRRAAICCVSLEEMNCISSFLGASPRALGAGVALFGVLAAFGGLLTQPLPSLGRRDATKKDLLFKKW